jgi:transcriptional regulator with XRE-family HTH domain
VSIGDAETQPRRINQVRRAQRSLADSIATWRKLRGLTQAQLAERADVSRGVIRRIEGADGGVSVENLLRISRALGTALDARCLGLIAGGSIEINLSPTQG